MFDLSEVVSAINRYRDRKQLVLLFSDRGDVFGKAKMLRDDVGRYLYRPSFDSEYCSTFCHIPLVVGGVGLRGTVIELWDEAF